MIDCSEDVVTEDSELGTLSLHSTDQEDWSSAGGVSEVSDMKPGLVVSLTDNSGHLWGIVIVSREIKNQIFNKYLQNQ